MSASVPRGHLGALAFDLHDPGHAVKAIEQVGQPRHADATVAVRKARVGAERVRGIDLRQLAARSFVRPVRAHWSFDRASAS